MDEVNNVGNVNAGVNKPKKKKTLLIIGGILAFLVVCCIGIVIISALTKSDTEEGASSLEVSDSSIPNETQEENISESEVSEQQEVSNTATLQPTATQKPTSTPKPTNTPQPTATVNPYLLSAGTYRVGTDIEPGIYQGQAGDSMWDSCYWERLKDLSGGLDSILANDNAVGQFYIEVLSSDYALTVRCIISHIDGIQAPENFYTEIGPGTYIVGRDIQPGLFKGQAGEDIMDSCYWARLRNVSGGLNSIITNENAIGQFFIQVSPSDFAISVNCPVTYEGQ
jgi:hypothetical protein